MPDTQDNTQQNNISKVTTQQSFSGDPKLPLDRILYNIYHIDIDQSEQSDLHTLIKELRTYIDTLPKEYNPDYNTDPVILNYEDFANRIYLQLLKDNKASKLYIQDIIDNIDYIQQYKVIPTSQSVDLTYLLTAIKANLNQYTALLDYIQKYQEQYKVQVLSDDVKYHNSFVSFVSYTVNNYINILAELSTTLENTNNNLKRATYTYLLELDYSIIDTYTDNQYFTANLVAVQNSRLFRNRKDTIIAIGDAISVLNIIRMLWFYIYTTQLSLSSNTEQDNTNTYQQIQDLIDQFLENFDPTLLDKILDYLDQLDTDDTNINNKSEIITATKDASKSLPSLTIKSFPELIDKLIGFINSFQKTLSILQLNPNYSALQNLLNKLTLLLETILSLLPKGTWAKEQLAKVNKFIDKINTYINKISQLLCSMRQLLCIISGFIYFNESVTQPMLNQIKSLISQATNGLTTLTSMFDSEIEMANNIIRKAIFELARVKCLSKTYSVSVAAGKSTDSNWITAYNAAVETAITGKSNDSIFELMKASASSYITSLQDQFNKSISKSSAVNCPPIISPKLNLRVPSLRKNYYPSINKVNTQVIC